MSRKLTACLLPAVALAAGLAATSAAVPAAARSCTPGSFKYSLYLSPPGNESMWWTSSSSPSGCEQIRPKIRSDLGLPYVGGWVRYDNGVFSTATTSQDSSDRSGLAKAWEERRAYGGSQIQCRRVYPTVGSWYDCAG